MLRHERIGPYQLHCLIAACHATAARPADTDWARIVMLYDRLLALVPAPTVRLNRAVAVAMATGPQAGLDLLDELAVGELTDHHLLPATRADLLRRLGQPTAAREQYRLALALAGNERERSYLIGRLSECGRP
ncbi:hypothetical protein [Nonomuraea sp. NPDC002799]